MLPADEARVTFQEAASLLPGRPHPTTLWRWCRVGLDGVFLEYEKVGRILFTSREAIQRFVHTSTEQHKNTTHSAS